jgi:hypothetical protein
MEEFYLTSPKNRRLYPSNLYPLTHTIHYQNCQYNFKDKSFIFKHTFSILIISFICIYYMSSMYRNKWASQTHSYNSFNNPQHLNLKEFIEYVDDFSNAGPINAQKFQYIQVELGKGNIQTPESSYETIRQYLNPETRRPNEHIATFKSVKKPWIYVKLPTRHVKEVHTKFPFNFSKFSIETLRCTLNDLLTKTPTNLIRELRKNQIW